MIQFIIGVIVGAGVAIFAIALIAIGDDDE